MFKLFKSPLEKAFSKITHQTAMLLREQIDGARKVNPTWNSKFSDDFVFGYIFSFCVIIIKSKLGDDKLAGEGTEQVFNNLFGKQNGILYFSRISTIQDEPGYQEGVEQARLDLFEFINNKGERPHSLFDYLSSN